MKFLLLTWSLLIFIVSTGFSQFSAGLYSSADLNYNSPHLFLDNYYQPGVSAGFITNYDLSAKFVISSGVTYTHKYSEGRQFLFDDGPLAVTQNLNALEIPLQVRYNLSRAKKITPYLFGGFTLSLALDYEKSFYTGNQLTFQSRDYVANGKELLMDFGVGFDYQINQHYHLLVQPTYRPIGSWNKFGLGIGLTKYF